MLNQFLFQTFSFIVHVLSAFSALVMAWIIFDSRFEESLKVKSTPKYMQSLGFLCLSLYLLLGRSFDFPATVIAGVQSLFVFGLFLLISGYYLEPTPLLKFNKEVKRPRGSAPNAYKIIPALTLFFMIPFLASLVAWVSTVMQNDYLGMLVLWNTYFNHIIIGLLALLLILMLVKYTRGLQTQLKPMLLGFFGLLLAYITLTISLYLSSDLRFDMWTGMYGILWVLERVFILIGSLFIGRYGLYFMRFRLKPQLFVYFISSALLIFFTVTIVFLLILLRDFQANTLFNLKSSAKAIEISIVEKRNDSILAAKALVNDSSVILAVDAEISSDLTAAVQDILQTSGADYILVTNEGALSLYDSRDPEYFAESFSNDKYLVRALEGSSTNTLMREEGVLAPQLVSRTYLPIVKDKKVIGGLVVGFSIDNQLVDALKEKTGLEVTLFVDNIRSASTFTTDGGVQRMVGTLEEDPVIIGTVLGQGKTYEGTVEVFNVQYLGVYSPLLDDDDNIIGMVFVGEPSRILAAIAGQSIQDTLKWISLLILLSLIPIYFFVKRIAMSQLV